MRELCNCGNCRKCRHRECVREARRRDKEEREALLKKCKEGEREFEIMQSLFDHGALQPSSTLNPNVYFNTKGMKDTFDYTFVPMRTCHSKGLSFVGKNNIGK